MANPQHAALAKRGVAAISRWREQTFQSRARLDISGAYLSGAKLPGGDFSHDLLSGIDLTDSDLRRSNMSGTNLQAAFLSRSQMSRSNLQGAILRNAALNRVDLSGSWLADADLRGADLSFADLSFTDLTGANLSGANLRGTNFSYADLSNVSLRDAQLQGSNLQVANLTGVDLRRASLVRVEMRGAILAEATLEMTLFADCDLSQVLGLESVRHVGPSIIGLDTLVRSRGLITPGFLRQAGVAEPLVSIQGYLRETGASSTRILLVSSVKDGEFVDRLETDLRRGGNCCWRLPVDDEGGFSDNEVVPALERSSYFDQLVMVCSSSSLESPYGWRCFEQLWQEHGSGPLTSSRIIPLALDDRLLKDQHQWCLDLVKSPSIDFRNWTDRGHYNNALKLLKVALVAPPTPREAEEPLAPVGG